jgi:hypothetical protein
LKFEIYLNDIQNSVFTPEIKGPGTVWKTNRIKIFNVYSS